MDAKPRDSATTSLREASAEKLARLAAALGCPVSAFADGRTDIPELDDFHEMVTLWNALPDRAARLRILQVMRATALH